MEYRNLGGTGLKVSELCLGTMTFGWSSDKDESFDIMDHAYDAGLTFFDTADVYSKWAEGNPGGVAEEWIGDWLQSKDRRSLIIATKVRGRMWEGPNGEGLSRVHIMQAVEDSLRRLKTDYIDLYQSHYFDETTPIEETLRAYDDLVRQGKVRYIGASNYPAWRLMKTLWTSDVNNLVRYESLQPHYSLVHRAEFERELMAVCEDQQIGVIPYSPLAAGFLTGKYRRDSQPETTRSSRASRYMTDQTLTLLDKLDDIASAHDKSVSQVALAWQLTQPVITSPIIGARTVHQLDESLGAVGFRLSPDEMDTLNKASAWQG